MAAVVEERVDSFLQHALFVADDDLRGFELSRRFLRRLLRLMTRR
jgi:hypothetical protein